MSDSKTERGQFRSAELFLLQKYANLDIWGKETSKNIYNYPLLINNPEELIAQGQKIAKVKPEIPEERLHKLGPFLTTDSPESHISPYWSAIDFLVPDGTPVVAAADGWIVEAEDRSNKWGPDPKYRDYLNYLTIQGENGEYAQYCHLGRGSIKKNNLSTGKFVTAGQVIATVGKTGWTDRDHLHFIVYRLKRVDEIENPFDFMGLKPRFKE